MRRAVVAGALLCAGLVGALPDARAGSLRLCDPARHWSADHQDRLLRVAAVLKEELERSGRRVALVSRSGLDLERFGQVYSHAGFSLKDHPDGAWTVRQLYYACEEQAPRLFDQGLAGFVFGTDDPRRGHLSMVTLAAGEDPAADAGIVRWVLDNRRALGLLGAAYQWVIEMLAAAWGGGRAGPDLRRQAQQWLRSQGFAPTLITLGTPWWRLAAVFVPWVHQDDHPPEDLQQDRVQLTMPPSIEAFVRRQWPGAERVELCHDEQRLVLRRGWQALGADCRPAAGDDVRPWR
jgi:hypothetical protein